MWQGLHDRNQASGGGGGRSRGGWEGGGVVLNYSLSWIWVNTVTGGHGLQCLVDGLKLPCLNPTSSQLQVLF